MVKDFCCEILWALWQICEDIKLDNGTIQPLQCLWDHFPAILYSVFWLKLITSSALYHYDSAERCEVDSADFIISHFHMNNSAEEALNLSTYLCSAHKMHNTNVRAHTEVLTYSPLHSPILKPAHYHR